MCDWRVVVKKSSPRYLDVMPMSPMMTSHGGSIREMGQIRSVYGDALCEIRQGHD